MGIGYPSGVLLFFSRIQLTYKSKNKVVLTRDGVMLALPGLLLLFVLTTVFWWQLNSSGDSLRRATRANAELRVTQVTDALVEAVGMLFFNVDAAVQSLIDFYGQNSKADVFDQHVKVITQRFPAGSVMQVSVIGADGYLVYSNLGSKDKVYLGDREHFTVHQNRAVNQLFVSKPLMGKVSKRWTIQFSRPIRANGRFQGVLVLSLSPDYLYQGLARLAQDPNDVIMILRNSGEVMARNRDMDQVVGVKLNQRMPFDDSAPLEQGTFEARSSIDHMERLYHWHHLGEYPVIVSLGLGLSGVMAPVEKAIQDGQAKGWLISAVIWISAALVIFLTWRMQVNVRRRAEFEYAALHDPLTGLFNRQALMNHLDALMVTSRNRPIRFALLFIDLDGFKPINDRYGHATGDALLMAVAGRIKGCVRDGDEVARLGGDEFVVVCQDFQDTQEVRALLHRILDALMAPMRIDPHQLSVGASIGIAIYPEQGRTADELLVAADRSMYQMKAEHKGRVLSIVA